MADEKDPKSPATTSDEYDIMFPTWLKVCAILGGTDAMRRAGKTLMPAHEMETPERYADRLKSTTLYNGTELTINSWVGRPFSDPIVVEDLAPIPEEFTADVDHEGNALQVFARNWFKDGLAKGFSHVLIDMPRKNEGETRTAADDADVRPYWVHIPPENLFFAEAEVVNGRELLREVRMWETVTTREGFATTSVRQIRRIFIETLPDGTREGNVEIYRLKDARAKKEVWVVTDRYTYDLDVIPLVTFYADRQSFMIAKPPVQELVDKNIEHWQSASDQRSILTVTRFPQLCVTGVADKKKIKVGPYQYHYSSDPNAKFYYLEHTGAAIESGWRDLERLEAQMAEHGADFLKKRPGNETATARALDSAESTSPLQDVTIRFSDAVAMALTYTAQWLGGDFTGTVKISTDFGPESSDPAELGALTSSRQQRNISRKRYNAEMKRRGIYADDFDEDENAQELEQEAMEFSGDPGLGDGEDDGGTGDPAGNGGAGHGKEKTRAAA